jgi:hypothetical protein
VASDQHAIEHAAAEHEELLEEIDNPIERLKLLSGNDEEIARYLDAIEVRSPREREMLREISRTRPLARPEAFSQAHRNMVEALESLARHGWHGTTAGRRLGPLRWPVRWGVELVARYLVVSSSGARRGGSATCTGCARSRPCREAPSAPSSRRRTGTRSG